MSVRTFSEFQISSIFVKNHCSYRNTDISIFRCHIGSVAYSASIKTCHKFIPTLYVLFPNFKYQVILSRIILVTKIQISADFVVISQVMHIQLRLRLVTNLFWFGTYFFRISNIKCFCQESL